MISIMNMKQVNARRKVERIAPYIKGDMSVLDFGCGDLLFARELKQNLPDVSVTGVDVVDFGHRYKGVKYHQYDGVTLPFTNKSFDAVISWHVLHHTDEPFNLLKECMRVAKSKVFIVEPTYRGKWDIPGMRFMDWVFNVWKDRSISMPYRFASKKEWMREIRLLGWECEEIVDVELLPAWLPTGRSLLFVCKKKHSPR